ncbi:hypothetical protein TUM4249_21930 [Shewanella sp. KT0246]|nr:hypothetical protein TUM4249_21930 [Shewanella sp. KT0246]
MKHLTIISINVICMLFSMVTITQAIAADKVVEEQVAKEQAASETASQTQTEQALKTVPLKPSTTEKVEVGSIEPVDSVDTKETLASEPEAATVNDVVNSTTDEVVKQPETFTPITPVAAVDINPEDAAPISLDEVNSDSAIPTDRIRSVISNQEKAWNSGNIDAYMEGYWKSDKLRFVSNGKYNYGWDSILASYKRSYPTAQRMGKLSFNVREIKMLSNYAALVVGRWTLERAKDKPSGVFTLLIERIDDKWVITHDHSSD